MRVPIDIHEKFVMKFAPEDGRLDNEPELEALTACVRDARQASEALLSAASVIRSDRTLTPGMADIKIRELALRRSEPVVARLDAQRERAVAAIKAFNAASAAPPPPTDNVALQLEAEIRANLKGMPESDRKAVVGQAFGTKNLAIIGAVLRGPH